MALQVRAHVLGVDDGVEDVSHVSRSAKQGCWAKSLSLRRLAILMESSLVLATSSSIGSDWAIAELR